MYIGVVTPCGVQRTILGESGSLLSPCVFWGLNSGHQARQQASSQSPGILSLFLSLKSNKWGSVVHAYNLGTQEAEEEGLTSLRLAL